MYSGIPMGRNKADLIAEEQDSLDDIIRVLMQDDTILKSLKHLVLTGIRVRRRTLTI